MRKKTLLSKFSKENLHDDSFYSKASPSGTTMAGSNYVDLLIDFLTINLNHLAERNDVLSHFEELTSNTLSKCTDPDLHRILKEQGWTGTQFQLALDPPFIDAQSCLNALSNYYLKVSSQPVLNDIGSVVDIDSSSNLDQILPFCPDVLVKYLRKQPITNVSTGPRRLTFRGACMLADISGFSKFSGAMCSKGVSGLDDLREATNGFLGYFVKQVYEYQGDVIEFAGDALICAFRASAEGMEESCFRALQCAHVLRQHKTASLSTHIGVTCGEMQIGLLGGHNDQWCYVMNGDCVSQLASCIEDAGSQEVAFTQECYEYAKVYDNMPRTPIAFRNQLVIEDVSKPSGNVLLKAIGVKRTTVVPPPLSPFVHKNVEEAAHHGWGVLKHKYAHVDDVAFDVVIKQRSDHLVEKGRLAAVLDYARKTAAAEAADAAAAELASHTAQSLADDTPSDTAGASTNTPVPTKPFTKKKSAIMESYVSPLSSASSTSTPHSSSVASPNLTPNKVNKMASLATRSKVLMISPMFKSKLSSENLTSEVDQEKNHEERKVEEKDKEVSQLEPSDNTTTRTGSSSPSPLRSVSPVPLSGSFTGNPNSNLQGDSLKYSETSSVRSSDVDASTVASVKSESDKTLPEIPLNQNTCGGTTRTPPTAPSTAVPAAENSTRPPRNVTRSSPGIAELQKEQRGSPAGSNLFHHIAASEPEVVLTLPPARRMPSLPRLATGSEEQPRTVDISSAAGRVQSNRSVFDFSRETSCSSITEASVLGRSTSPACSVTVSAVPFSHQQLNSADRSADRPSSVSTMNMTMSRQSSMEQAKKRFAGWGVMKNAMRRESFREKYGTTESAFVQTISKFVPRPVLNAVHTECLDLIGELRQVTTLFCALNTYSDVINRDPCTLQPFFLMAQTVLHEAGGFLRQFLVDDKGCVFIAMWGVPSFTYSNNCSRALYCAAKIIEGGLEQDHKCSIGIATGTVFCGSVGALERRDYAGVGTDVNMAARLMGKARGRILIDQATYKSLNPETQALLTQAEEMNLKGMAAPTVPYQYSSSTLPLITDIDVESNQLSELRPKMQTSLIKLLDSFLNISADTDTQELLEKKLRVNFNFLFGLPGTGKSLAAQFYRNTARLRSINCIHIVAKSDAQGIPYGLLRELFLELIGRANFVTLDQKLDVIGRIINEICDETDPEEERTAAIQSLQLVLGIEPDEMESIRESILQRTPTMTASGKVDVSHYLDASISSPEREASRQTSSSQSRKGDDYTFYNVVAHLLHNTPTVLIIENAHFIDELSWKEFFLIQAGDQLDMSVLLTMEVAHIPAGRYQMEDSERSRVLSLKKPGVAMTSSQDGAYWDAKEGPADWDSPDSPELHKGSHEDLDALFDEGLANIGAVDGHGTMHASSRLIGKSPQSSKSMLSIDDEITDQRTLSIRSHPTEFWCAILDNHTSTVLVIGELSKEEIRQEMERSIEAQVLTDGLVDLVYTITAGNAYWCKAMMQFIRERGAEALFEAVSDRRSRQNPLKQLVLVHFETHTPEFQVISKHASIIGEEFDEVILQAIVPPKIRATLSASLDKLVEKRFLQCLNPQNRTFSFPNKLIQATIYELTPPSDAAHLHQAIAEFIESTFTFELRSHYPTLGYHYKRCPDKKDLAFKYELKAADQQVAKGAYSDGLYFLKSAAKLAEREVELDVVLEVINRAIEDIREESKQHATAPTNALMRLQSFYTGSTDTRTNGFILRYNALKRLVLRKKSTLHKATESVIASEKNADRKKELLQKARHDAQSGALTWQPSYVAGKRDSSQSTGMLTSRGDSNRSNKSIDERGTAGVSTGGCKCIIS